jgi:hypothetical protein
MCRFKPSTLHQNPSSSVSAVKGWCTAHATTAKQVHDRIEILGLCLGLNLQPQT